MPSFPLRSLLAVGLVVVLLVVFRNTSSLEKIPLRRHQLELNNLRGELIRGEDTVRLSTDKSTYILPVDSTVSGQALRLVFGYDSNYSAEALDAKSKQKFSPDPRLTVRRVLINGESETVGVINEAPTRGAQSREYLIPAPTQADLATTSITFTLEEPFFSNATLSNIKITGLGPLSQDQLSKLQSSIFGDRLYPVFQESIVPYQFRAFTRKNEQLCQPITENTEALSGVDLRLRARGSGGSGMYRLSLHRMVNGVVNSDYPVGIDFAVDQLGQYRLQESARPEENNIYHLPLAGYLDPAEKYAICLSNQGVSFSWLHTLEVGLSGTENGGLRIVQQKIQPTPSLSHRLYSVAVPSAFAKRILPGSTITDNGNGTATYTFSMRANQLGALDLDQSSTLRARKTNSGPFYDTVRYALAAPAKTEAEGLVYVVDTIYPFTSFQVFATGVAEAQPFALSYSFDGENWVTDLPDATNLEETTRLLVLKPDLASQNKVWVRVADIPGVNDLSRASLTALREITITAQLQL